MSDSIQRIVDRVCGVIAAGETVDVFGLADTLQPECPDMTFDQIADVVARVVVECGSTSFWDRRAHAAPN